MPVHVSGAEPERNQPYQKSVALRTRGGDGLEPDSFEPIPRVDHKTTDILERAFILHSFPQFKKIPVEIRNQIWRYCFPNRRIFRLNGRQNYTPITCAIFDPSAASIPKAHSRPRIIFKDWHFGFDDCGFTKPITLHICRESRNETLRYYFPLLNNSKLFDPFYFAPAFDTLAVHDGGYTKEFDEAAFTVFLELLNELPEQMNCIMSVLVDAKIIEKTPKARGLICLKSLLLLRDVTEVIVAVKPGICYAPVIERSWLRRYRRLITEAMEGQLNKNLDPLSIKMFTNQELHD